ncbi:DUF4364 family protein [Serpentinicella sp. ANB-PHB4]|uniref:DUF4364 family protein n=1 Tax=Serpentinicella sp. ANB-PHB4 TaxID=3074076 RepID=UPI00285912D5|nr:DUF4364 family protein [Serpentinicella sp. ANB-PHB4]MDR5659390.1 DUF4364 family protein [Serpentinicella sp. ANB-PHB4]
MFVNTSEQLAENKLVLLYILNEINMPVTNGQITEFILENDFMNYFMLQQYISELKEVGFVEVTEKDQLEYITLTKKGINTLDFFINRIPKNTINAINELVKSKKIEIIQSAQITADYKKLDNNECLVHLAVIEKDMPIMELTLNVPNVNQAKEICSNWKNHSEDIYSNIIHLLIKKSD